MSEELADEQSHYEISLTAGQAFVAFVLLLLSLAASFAFGLMIGKGQTDDRLVVRHDTPVVTEASAIPKKSAGKIVELGVSDDDFKKPSTATASDATTPVLTESLAAPTGAGSVVNATDAAPAKAPSASDATPEEKPLTSPSAAKSDEALSHEAKPAAAPAHDLKSPAASPLPSSGPVFAQLLSTADQKTAETLATKVINGGFTSAYVERGTAAKGTIFRVRVRFATQAEAQAAEAKLREYSKDVWITR